MRAAGVDAPTVSPIAELFAPSAVALWATTYSVDIRLFDEFLMPRLGPAPLNVAVLADQRRLDASLNRLQVRDGHSLGGVNRRWLLRGVRTDGPAFHPKSYLSVRRDHAVLLVGSGNLSAGGLDGGREVFTTFYSGTPAGDRAIAAWLAWARHLVDGLNDALVDRRFADLYNRLPGTALAGAADPDTARAILLHNLAVPLADAALDTIAATSPGSPDRTVDELHLTAAYFDADADAAVRLVERLRPHTITVYVSSSTSVDGPVLRRRLTGHRLRVRGYQPDRYTHAKLIGVVAGERGWLLSGSANLSRAALWRVAGPGGNVELGVLADLPATDVRQAFEPPGGRVVDLGPESLDNLTLAAEEHLPDFPVRLLSAEVLDGGRIAVTADQPIQAGWQLTDVGRRYLLRIEPGRAVTDEPVDGRLIRLVDAGGATLCAPVIVDDVPALDAQLRAPREDDGRSRPAELLAGDLTTPLGQALQVLHSNLIMDAAEAAESAPRPAAGAGDVDEGVDDAFWARLERDHLQRDPRARRYTALGSAGADGLVEQLLDALGMRVPAGRRPTSLLQLLAETPARVEAAAADNPDTEDTTSRRAGVRLRVRTRNVLRRWAAAQTNPRLTWIDPRAPLHNFAVMTDVLAWLRLACALGWAGVHLTEADIDDVWWRWLAAFAGTGRDDGHLDGLAPQVRAEAVGGLSAEVTAAAAWLCWLAIKPGADHRNRVVQVQAVLAAALGHGVAVPNDMTTRCAQLIVGGGVTSSTLAQDLLDAACFDDDESWCARTAQNLRLTSLEFVPGRHRADRVWLLLAGVTAPLSDARIPPLLLELCRYRRCSAVTLVGVTTTSAPTERASVPDEGWRLLFDDGEPMGHIAPGPPAELIDSTAEVHVADLHALHAAVDTLASLFED